jgi:hypothetical protein
MNGGARLGPRPLDSQVYTFNYEALLLNKSINLITVIRVHICLYMLAYIKMHVCKHKDIIKLIVENYGA